MKKKINIAQVGSGFFGKIHAEGWALLPILLPDVAAIPVRKVLCDITEERASKAANDYGFEEYCVGVDELLKRDDIDIVDICTPSGTHQEVYISCLKSGKFKFVFAEKPLANTLEGAKEIYKVSKEVNCPTGIGFNKRHWPAVAYTKELLDEGYIGKPIFYRGKYFQSFNLGSDKRASETKRIKGSGMDESACHIVDLARYFFGDIEDIVGMHQTFYKETLSRPLKEGEELSDIPKVPRDLEDTTAFMGHTKEGMMASFEFSSVFSGEYEGVGYEIFGEKGAIRWYGQRAMELEVQSQLDSEGVQGFRTVFLGKPGHPYSNGMPALPGFGVGVNSCMAFQFYDVVNAYIQNKPYKPDFEDGLKAAQVMEAVRISEKERKWVKIDEL